MTTQNQGAGPGQSDAVFTQTYQLFWGGSYQKLDILRQSHTIAGAARDLGNTPQTDVLRPGLMLAKVTASGELMPYDPAATDGTENFLAMNEEELIMTNRRSGADEPKSHANVIIQAPVVANAVIVNGVLLTALPAGDQVAPRAALKDAGFVLDDRLDQ